MKEKLPFTSTTMPKLSWPMYVCSECSIPLTEREAVFLDSLNNITKYPVCGSCYERNIRMSCSQFSTMARRSDYFNQRRPCAVDRGKTRTFDFSQTEEQK